eukprot:FR739396.1.p1 GENE.FR739396.1~~FR739396.1.p1  ORF type:complete len:135 (+),score=0.35 FR739396.1:315-719(+)
MKEGLDVKEGPRIPWGPAENFRGAPYSFCMGFYWRNLRYCSDKKLPGINTAHGRQTPQILSPSCCQFYYIPNTEGIVHYGGAMMYLAGLDKSEKLATSKTTMYAIAIESYSKMNVDNTWDPHHTRAMATQVSDI